MPKEEFLARPVAIQASQMAFTDGGYFVIVLDVSLAQGATFNTATCTDANGNNPVNWPLKTGTTPYQFTFNTLTLLRLILVASAPGSHDLTGTGLFTITLQNPAITVGPITVLPDPVNPCS